MDTTSNQENSRPPVRDYLRDALLGLILMAIGWSANSLVGLREQVAVLSVQLLNAQSWNEATGEVMQNRQDRIEALQRDHGNRITRLEGRFLIREDEPAGVDRRNRE